ncbi:MAG: PEGA domain-containing protein [Planctomycetota bacterium]
MRKTYLTLFCGLVAMTFMGCAHISHAEYNRQRTDYAFVEINSEPQGARIYCDGKLLGTTPCKLQCTIRDDHYQRGEILLTPLIAVADGCLPSGPVELRLEIPNQKPYSDTEYISFANHSFGHLFILRRDPNYTPPAVIMQPSGGNTEVNVQTQRDKDFLDYMEQLQRMSIRQQTLKAKGR